MQNNSTLLKLAAKLEPKTQNGDAKMDKSTHGQNLTGNRFHAPVDDDYKRQLAETFVRRIMDANCQCMDDVNAILDKKAIKEQWPGVWEMVREGVVAARAAQSRKRQSELMGMCQRMENDRLAPLVA